MAYNKPVPESKKRTNAASGIEGLVQAEKLLQIAFVLPSAAVIGLGAGWWADKALHQKWIEIAGVVLGSVAGLFYVVRMAIAAERASRSEDASGQDRSKSSKL